MVFRPLSAPDDRLLGPVEGWATWSHDSLNLLCQLTEFEDLLPEPELVRFGFGEYDLSLDLPPNCALPPPLLARLEKFAVSLHEETKRSSLKLLTGLIPAGISSHAVRLLFAATRSIIAGLTGDPYSALFAPLGSTGRRKHMKFRLHADLYPGRYLLNVFDNVPSDLSGASLFLPIEKFEHVLSSIPSVPAEIRSTMFDCLNHPACTDRYQYFYDLLNGDYAWTDELQEKLDAETYSIKLFRGEGYLLDDRKWLHGRTAPTGGVPVNRLYRLVFDSRDTLAERRRTECKLLGPN